MIEMAGVLPILAELKGLDASRLPASSGSGRWEGKLFRCVLPGHEDRNASAQARYGTADKPGGWYRCFACNGDGLSTVALIKACVGAADDAAVFKWAEINLPGYVPGQRRGTKPEPRKPYRSPWAED